MISVRTRGPLYLIIKEDLLSRIASGTWTLGQQLPGDEALQRTYGVSRGTVRRALHELVMEGYIIRQAGRGTFVRRTTPPLAVGEIPSFTRQMKDAGLTLRTQLLSVGLLRASEAGGRVLEGFGVPGDAEVYQVRRLRWGDDRPLAVQTVYLLPERCPGLPERDLTHLFALYADAYDCTIHAVDEVMRLAEAPAGEAALLHLPAGSLVLIRDRISYDQDGRPFEVLHTVDHPDGFIYRYRITDDDSMPRV